MLARHYSTGSAACLTRAIVLAYLLCQSDAFTTGLLCAPSAAATSGCHSAQALSSLSLRPSAAYRPSRPARPILLGVLPTPGRVVDRDRSRRRKSPSALLVLRGRTTVVAGNCTSTELRIGRRCLSAVDGDGSELRNLQQIRSKRLALHALNKETSPEQDEMLDGDVTTTAAAAATGSSTPSSALPAEKASPSKVNKRRNRGDKKKEEKSPLGKAGDAAKTAFNAVMAVGTLASLLLAAETLWELQGTPLTLANAIPTLTRLLPLTGIGVFGAAQLVGLVARVVRVVVTLPIMLSGTWVILRNAPQLLPKGSDLSGAGGLVALLATPEVLETAAVLALLGGTVIWALNFAGGAVGAVLGRADASPSPDDGGNDES